MISNPGRIGLTQIHGRVGAGIRFGQWLNGSGFEDFEHAFLDIGGGMLIEAEPGGARIRPLSKYTDAEVHWCDNIYTNVAPQIRNAIADAGRELRGVKYSFMDYGALAAHRLGLDTAWLEEYINNSGHLICSQLVDLAYTRGGYKIFHDDRWNGFVTPGDLFLADMRAAYDTLTWDRSWDFQLG